MRYPHFTNREGDRIEEVGLPHSKKQHRHTCQIPSSAFCLLFEMNIKAPKWQGNCSSSQTGQWKHFSPQGPACPLAQRPDSLNVPHSAIFAPCITVLFKVLYCKIKNVFFIFCVHFLMYYLCEKYYKPITVKYYTGDCVSWVPSLILLDVWTNWTYECTLRRKLICM